MGLFSSKNSKTTSTEQSKSTTDARSDKTATGPSESSLATSDRAGSESNSFLRHRAKPTGNHQSGDNPPRSTQKRGRSASESKGEKNMASIGQSIVFKGELSGDEDLEIDGQVEGSVHLDNNELIVGANGHLKAEVNAKSIIVIGRVKGNLTATERIEIQSTGIVEGDIRAPKLLIQEGAVLNGGIDMSSGTATAGQSVSGSSSPTATGNASDEAHASA